MGSLERYLWTPGASAVPCIHERRTGETARDRTALQGIESVLLKSKNFVVRRGHIQSARRQEAALRPVTPPIVRWSSREQTQERSKATTHLAPTRRPAPDSRSLTMAMDAIHKSTRLSLGRAPRPLRAGSIVMRLELFVWRQDMVAYNAVGHSVEGVRSKTQTRALGASDQMRPPLDATLTGCRNLPKPSGAPGCTCGKGHGSQLFHHRSNEETASFPQHRRLWSE